MTDEQVGEIEAGAMEGVKEAVNSREKVRKSVKIMKMSRRRL